MATRTDAKGKQARLPAGHGGRHAETPTSWSLNQAPRQRTWDGGSGGSYGDDLLVLKHQDMATQDMATQVTSRGQKCPPNCLPEGFGHKQGHPNSMFGLLCEPNFLSLK